MAVGYTDAEIIIYLTTNGDHYALRDMNDNLKRNGDSIDDWSSDISMVIKPLPCSLAGGSYSHLCDSSGS